MQCGAGCDGGRRMPCEAEAVEGSGLQLPFEQRDRVVGAEGPGIQAGLGTDGIKSGAERLRRQRREEGSLRGEKQLGRLLACEFIEAKRSCRIPLKLCGAELASGEIEQGKADANYIHDVIKAQSVVTIHDGSPYAQQLQQVMADNFKQLGGKVLSQKD